MDLGSERAGGEEVEESGENPGLSWEREPLASICLIASWHLVWLALRLALLVILLTMRVPTEVSKRTKNKTPTMMDPMVRGVISSIPRGEAASVEISLKGDSEVVVVDDLLGSRGGAGNFPSFLLEDQK